MTRPPPSFRTRAANTQGGQEEDLLAEEGRIEELCQALDTVGTVTLHVLLHGDHDGLLGRSPCVCCYTTLVTQLSQKRHIGN